jgi:hypothetical protein
MITALLGRDRPRGDVRGLQQGRHHFYGERGGFLPYRLRCGSGRLDPASPAPLIGMVRLLSVGFRIDRITSGSQLQPLVEPQPSQT